MPYKVSKVPGGYKVQKAHQGGKPVYYSGKAMSQAKAKAQMRALYAKMKGGKGKGGGILDMILGPITSLFGGTLLGGTLEDDKRYLADLEQRIANCMQEIQRALTAGKSKGDASIRTVFRILYPLIQKLKKMGGKMNEKHPFKRQIVTDINKVGQFLRWYRQLQDSAGGDPVQVADDVWAGPPELRAEAATLPDPPPHPFDAHIPHSKGLALASQRDAELEQRIRAAEAAAAAAAPPPPPPPDEPPLRYGYVPPVLTEEEERVAAYERWLKAHEATLARRREQYKKAKAAPAAAASRAAGEPIPGLPGSSSSSSGEPVRRKGHMAEMVDALALAGPSSDEHAELAPPPPRRKTRVRTGMPEPPEPLPPPRPPPDDDDDMTLWPNDDRTSYPPAAPPGSGFYGGGGGPPYGGDFMDFLRGIAHTAGNVLNVSSKIGDAITGPLVHTILPGAAGDAAEAAIGIGNSTVRNAFGVHDDEQQQQHYGEGLVSRMRQFERASAPGVINSSMMGSGRYRGAAGYGLGGRMGSRLELDDPYKAAQVVVTPSDHPAPDIFIPGDAAMPMIKRAVLPFMSGGPTPRPVPAAADRLMNPAHRRGPAYPYMDVRGYATRARAPDGTADAAYDAVRGKGPYAFALEVDMGSALELRSNAGVPMTAKAVMHMTGENIPLLRGLSSPAGALSLTLKPAARPEVGDQQFNYTF